jgi:hypothetical protein
MRMGQVKYEGKRQELGNIRDNSVLVPNLSPSTSS